jgi:hypothetical protein
MNEKPLIASGFFVKYTGILFFGTYFVISQLNSKDKSYEKDIYNHTEITGNYCHYYIYSFLQAGNNPYSNPDAGHLAGN